MKKLLLASALSCAAGYGANEYFGSTDTDLSAKPESVKIVEDGIQLTFGGVERWYPNGEAAVKGLAMHFCYEIPRVGDDPESNSLHLTAVTRNKIIELDPELDFRGPQAYTAWRESFTNGDPQIRGPYKNGKNIFPVSAGDDCSELIGTGFNH